MSDKESKMFSVDEPVVFEMFGVMREGVIVDRRSDKYSVLVKRNCWDDEEFNSFVVKNVPKDRLENAKDYYIDVAQASTL